MLAGSLSSGTQIELRFVLSLSLSRSRSLFFLPPRSGAFRDNTSLLYGNNSLSVSLNTEASAAVIR